MMDGQAARSVNFGPPKVRQPAVGSLGSSTILTHRIPARRRAQDRPARVSGRVKSRRHQTSAEERKTNKKGQK
jgi:hypothetical protein